MKKVWNFCARYSKVIMLVSLVIAIVYPFIAKTRYLVGVGITCLMNAALAASMNLIIGSLGQMSMAHSAFWGIGAYTAAILSTRLGVGSLGTLVIAMAVAGLFSLLLGLPVLKLKGYYLTVVTLGFCEIIRLVELNWTSLTNGALGISRVKTFSFFGALIKDRMIIYYIMLLILIFVIIVLSNLLNSKHGMAILSIRDDEIAAASVGINVFRHKMLVFIIAGMIAGMVGSFYAHYLSFVDSTDFTTKASMNFAIFAIFGGLGSIPGAIGGSIILTVIPEVLRFLQTYRTLFYGAIIVIILLFKPDGILGSVNFKYIRQRQLSAGKGSRK